MQTGVTHSGDLSQDSASNPLHPTSVKPALQRSVDVRSTSLGTSVDPATRMGRSFYRALSASSVGLEFGIAVAISLAFGLWLDGKLGTTPWMMLLWLLVGFIAGFRGVIKAVNRSDRWTEADHG